ncbi:MAG: type II toxin-antitoxin system YafQ family toxin [Campylobacter sp.]|nr:type II toxin-antitoxin system YafQ family toxin [Campylobacter sp.]
MAKYKFEPSSKFAKEYKKLSENDKIATKEVINLLLNGEKLPAKNKDHSLTGNFKDYRECHIKPDLLMVYKIDKSVLILYCFRIGSHSELFG